ncbi:MAG: hypothetical protein E7630_05395 [Ruminococcaceae bacterium]|nr:hypothetical protein [Oscillospiraceae bacterium]
MKRKQTVLALLLAAAMLLPCFMVSCSRTDYDVVMEYNGIKLTEDMYYYWMSTFKRNILSSYSDARDTEAFWGQKYDDTRTVGEYFTEIIQRRIMNYLICQDLYKKNSLKLEDDVKQAIKDDINEKIQYYGSRGALNQELAAVMMDVDSLKDVYTWEEKHDCVYNWLYGKGGVNEVTDAKLTEYYEKNYSCIRYIVFYTTKIETDKDGNYVYDENGQPVTKDLTEEELNKKLADVEACFDKLKNGGDFEALRKQYSEYDTSAYPNGFLLSANELSIWGPDIILATQKAKAGDVYKVEEESAVFLLCKYELPGLGSLGESDLEQIQGLSSYATAELYDEFFGELQKNVVLHQDVLAKYRLETVKASPFYSM